ncbi:MAG: CHAT domain-containing protein [Candidatus Parabeggiatoa sp.]|nr:CHAT domain-containing protein [Candidatus Parabeggiatoa sp.]
MNFKTHSIVFAILMLLFSSALSAEAFSATPDNSFSFMGEWRKLWEWKKLTEKAVRAIRQEDFDEALKWAEKADHYARQYFDNNAYQINLITSLNIKLYALAMKAIEAYSKHELQKGLELTAKVNQLFKQHFGNQHGFTMLSLKIINFKHSIHSLLNWLALSAKTALAIQKEDHDEVLKWLEKSYDYARLHFEDDYRQILTTTATGYIEFLTVKAVEFNQKDDYKKVFELAQKIKKLNAEHFSHKKEYSALNVLNIIMPYYFNGNYREAEQALKQALSLSKASENKNYPDQVRILTYLALLYELYGRYGEAESYYKQAYSLNSHKIPDSDRIVTWIILNYLAKLYLIQGRYEEAKSTYDKVYSLRDEIPQSNWPGVIKNVLNTQIFLNKIDTLQGLAAVNTEPKHYKEAEYYLKKALLIAQFRLGVKHRKTLDIYYQLATLYEFQNRSDEAESLFETTYLAQKEVLGTEEPSTLITRLNLAHFYYSHGNYEEATNLYEKTLPLRPLHHLRKKLGYEHPDVFKNYILYATYLGKSNPKKSLDLLKIIEPVQFFYAKGQFYTTEKERVRRSLYNRLTIIFQSVVFSLAHRSPSDKDITRFAVNTLLRWKQPQAEEEAIISKLLHDSKNSVVSQKSQEIQSLRAQLSHQLSQVDKTKISLLGEKLETAELEGVQLSSRYNAYLKAIEENTKRLKEAELEMAELSSYYKSHLEFMAADIEQVRAKLPKNRALIEFRSYSCVDFNRGRIAEGFGTHWMAVLLTKDKTILKDLGPIKKTKKLWEKLKQEGSKEAAKQLYENLFGAFDEHIKHLDAVYIAPDSFLNLIPYSRLILPDGRYWIERQTLHQVQTGRDLLREKPEPSSDLLVAIGGVNFARFPKKKMRHQQTENDRGSAKIMPFKGLRQTRYEVQDIAYIYPGQSDIWKGKKASEGRLKGLTEVPRVLHLATHAFYLEQKADELGLIRPLTLSGIALSGANRGLNAKDKGQFDPDGEDGILYALEALNLNLNGTELVVLSACETGKGLIDYSEGVYGLVRAFKIAGAYRLLMTLWKVKDKATKMFMIEFYKKWLETDQAGNQKYWDDPAKALQETQKYYINHPNEKWRDPKVWSAYVLVGP